MSGGGRYGRCLYFQAIDTFEPKLMISFETASVFAVDDASSVHVSRVICSHPVNLRSLTISAASSHKLYLRD
jgi:hypothetical protein